jgi:hypothetical protein
MAAGWLFGAEFSRLAPWFFEPKLPALVRPRRNGFEARRYGHNAQWCAVQRRTSAA